MYVQWRKTLYHARIAVSIKRTTINIGSCLRTGRTVSTIFTRLSVWCGCTLVIRKVSKSLAELSAVLLNPKIVVTLRNRRVLTYLALKRRRKKHKHTDKHKCVPSLCWWYKTKYSSLWWLKFWRRNSHFFWNTKVYNKCIIGIKQEIQKFSYI